MEAYGYFLSLGCFFETLFILFLHGSVSLCNPSCYACLRKLDVWTKCYIYKKSASIMTRYHDGSNLNCCTWTQTADSLTWLWVGPSQTKRFKKWVGIFWRFSHRRIVSWALRGSGARPNIICEFCFNCIKWRLAVCILFGNFLIVSLRLTFCLSELAVISCFFCSVTSTDAALHIFVRFHG